MHSSSIHLCYIGGYDRGTSNEGEMMEEVNISNFKLERAGNRI